MRYAAWRGPGTRSGSLPVARTVVCDLALLPPCSKTEERQRRSPGLTSRFHELCACAALRKIRVSEPTCERSSALLKLASARPIEVRSACFGSNDLHVIAAVPPPTDESAFQPAGTSERRRSAAFAAAFPAGV